MRPIGLVRRRARLGGLLNYIRASCVKGLRQPTTRPRIVKATNAYVRRRYGCLGNRQGPDT